MRLKCKPTSGEKFQVEAEEEQSVESLKQQLAEPSGIAAEQQRVIWRGQVLQNSRTLASYGVQPDHTLHLVASAPPSQRVGTAAGSAPSQPERQRSQPSHPSQPGAGNDAVSQLLGGGSESAMLQGMLRSGGEDGSMEQLQQQLQSDPEQMQQMLNSPMMQTLMQQMENNPEMLRHMVEQNPQVSEQMAQQNPQMYHMMRDPEMLRQMLRMMRNPQLMQEEMRSADRAMSHLETNPEGYQMMRRMWEDMNSTMQDSMDSGESDGGTSRQSARAQQAQQEGGTGQGDGSPNSQPLPNPWSAGGQQREQPAGAAGLRSAPDVGSLLSGMQGQQSQLGGGGSQSTADPLRSGAGGNSLETAQQMMNDPNMRQMFDQIVSNPQLMESVVQANPQLQQMMNSNPVLAQVLRDPSVMRQAMDPQNLQQLSQMQEEMQQLSGQSGNQPDMNQLMSLLGGGAQQPHGGAGAGAAQPDMSQLMNLLGGGGGAQTQEQGAAQAQQPPQERFATQLQQLREMGFLSEEENVRALEVRAFPPHPALT